MLRHTQASRPAPGRRYPAAAPRLNAASVLSELDDVGEPAADNAWTVGYLDVLLLLLTLFAALLGINYLGGEVPTREPANQVDLISALPLSPPETRLVEPEIILAAYQARLPQPQAAAPTPPKPESPKPEQKKMLAAVPPVAETMPLVPQEPVLPSFLLDPVPGLLSDPAQPGLELFVDGQRLRVEMQDEILFPSGSAELGEGGRVLLQRLIDGLASKDIQISVQGHSDDLPIATTRFPSNWELSSYRATTVARHLIELGMAPEGLSVSGYADTRPRVLNDTPENRARNRRVTLVLHPEAVSARTKDVGMGDESVWRRL